MFAIIKDFGNDGFLEQSARDGPRENAEKKEVSLINLAKEANVVRKQKKGTIGVEPNREGLQNTRRSTTEG